MKFWVVLARVFYVLIIAGLGTTAAPGIALAAGIFAGCGDFKSFIYDSNLLAGTGGSCAAPTMGPGSEWHTQAYVGLSFSIGDDGLKPHFNAGVRGVNVGSDSTVYGVEANLSVSLSEGLKDLQFRALGLAGNTLILGNGGVGWDVEKRSFILNAGVQVPYVRAFVDFTIDDATLRAFLETNSYSMLPGAAPSLTCPSGTKLDSPSDALGDIASLFPGAYAIGDLFNGSVSNYAITNIIATANNAAFIDGKTCFETPDIALVP